MDETERPVGMYRPERISELRTPGPDAGLVERLRGVTGLSAAFSDALDTIGWTTCVPASILHPLRSDAVVIGRALTLRYLPARHALPSRLAHMTAWEQARPGDILAISAPPGSTASVLGGNAAAAAVAAGVQAVIVQGALRDLDEIDATGLASWSTSATPITGRGRLDAIEINGPVEIAGVQVVPGDVIIADRSGVAVVPRDHFEALAKVVLGD
jgi:regulator of RNase E activity RraA